MSVPRTSIGIGAHVFSSFLPSVGGDFELLGTPSSVKNTATSVLFHSPSYAQYFFVVLWESIL